MVYGVCVAPDITIILQVIPLHLEKLGAEGFMIGKFLMSLGMSLVQYSTRWRGKDGKAFVKHAVADGGYIQFPNKTRRDEMTEQEINIIATSM